MRYNLHPDRTPIQQSMTVDPDSYGSLNMHRMMLGVVLDVYPSDHASNRSAHQAENQLGFQHEATVLVMQDGSSTYMLLNNVVITPDGPSGLDDYCERLPRPTTGLTTGEPFNQSMAHINPFELDGDWCVIGFLGGSMDRPFILRWWPHSRNRVDPATSGQGSPNSQGRGTTLVQNKRFFHRINGLEFVVNRRGDLYISTARAGHLVSLGLPDSEGRLARASTSSGGSIRATIKPTQTVEFTWNPEEDGIGVLGRADPDLPQTNPRPNTPATANARDNTYLKMDRTSVQVEVPEDVILKSKRISNIADDQHTVTVSSSSITVTDASVDLGSTGGLPIVTNAWIASWAAAITALTTAIAAAPPVPTPVSNLALIQAIQTALNTMNSALSSAITTKTKAV